MAVEYSNYSLTGFRSWDERRGELPQPLSGNLYISHEDLTTILEKPIVLPPDAECMFILNLPESRGAREILNLSTAGISLRSKLGQCGLVTEMVGIDNSGIYVTALNCGDDQLCFPEARQIEIGRLRAFGEPLQDDKLLAQLHNIHTPLKRVIVEDGTPSGVAFPIVSYMRKNGPVGQINVTELPRGTTRKKLHPALNLQEEPYDYQKSSRPTEIVATAAVILSGGIALRVVNTTNGDIVHQHGPSDIASNESTDHTLIGEFLMRENGIILPRELHTQVFHQIDCR